MPRRVVIAGAAGRDFHNFNVAFRDDPSHDVVAFTATQIPQIDDRRYPASLAGARYPDGIPIEPEADLERIVRERAVDEVVLAYSDLPYGTVGNLSARVHAAGADFTILGPRRTMLRATVPVVSVTAVRTGCGKSQTSRFVARALRDAGHRVVAVRHPMPYGDLAKQAVQRFAARADLDEHDCTFEEREEYEKYVDEGLVIYAGVDYGAILEQAQAECDVLIWDGGNNDWPFYESDLWITVADPLRAGHEVGYFPGEVNFRAADVVLINKIDSADPADVDAVEARARALNPDATVVRARSEVSVPDPSLVSGKRVLCVEDGPTLTHGEMTLGAGQVAAERFGAAEVVDPRPYAVRSIADTLRKYAHVGPLLPAMGYFPEQIKDLEDSINATDCDLVLVGTPFDLSSKLDIHKPAVRVSYELDVPDDQPSLGDLVLSVMKNAGRQSP
jgi:predicted GTPase